MLKIQIERNGVAIAQVTIPEPAGAQASVRSTAGTAAANRIRSSYAETRSAAPPKTGGNGSFDTGGDGSFVSGGDGSFVTGGNGSMVTGGDGSFDTGTNPSTAQNAGIVIPITINING